MTFWDFADHHTGAVLAAVFFLYAAIACVAAAWGKRGR
jgi:hypothetical protein